MAKAKKRQNNNRNKNTKRDFVPKKQEVSVTEITYSGQISVGELAKLMHKQASEIIKFLFLLGNMATINTILDDENIELVGMEFGIEVHKENIVEEFNFEEIDRKSVV